MEASFFIALNRVGKNWVYTLIISFVLRMVYNKGSRSAASEMPRSSAICSLLHTAQLANNTTGELQ